MFKKSTFRLLDIMIEDCKGKVETEEEMEAVIVLEAIRLNEDLNKIKIELKAWMKGYGSAIASLGFVYLISKLIKMM